MFAVVPSATFCVKGSLFVHDKLKNCLNIWTIYVRVCMSAKYTVGWSLYVLAVKNVWCMYISINTPAPYAERYS